MLKAYYRPVAASPYKLKGLAEVWRKKAFATVKGKLVQCVNNKIDSSTTLR
jgi:hypothetical protein